MKTYEWIKINNQPKKWIDTHDQDACFRHLCTYGDQHQIYETVQEKLENAKHSVEIVNFIINHEDLIETIIKARREKKRYVRVMTWLDQRKHLYIEEDNIFNLFKTQARSWRKLARNDVPLRSNINCHIKMMLIDKETAIISSANLSKTSLTRNPENGVLITNMKEEINIIQKFFKAIWKNYANTEIGPLPPHVTASYIEANDDEYLRVQTRSTNHDPEFLDGFAHETDNFRFLFTGPCYNTLHAFIIEMIERAEEEILLLSFKIDNVQQIGLLRIIKEKIRCGVIVRILVCRKETQIREKYGKLLEIGCEVNAIDYNHAKGIVVDQEEVMIMTANIDNYIMLHKESINIGIYFKNKSYGEQAKEFINFLFENRTHTLRAL